MKITASAPMRVDLAGGTLDVYPLYIFEDGGLTVNAAIDIMATSTIETRHDSRIHLHSEDLGITEEYPGLEEMAAGGPLELVRRALRYYRPKTGLDITIRSDAPRGSGLGASSALLMTLSTCLNELTGRGLAREEIIDVGANIEAQVVAIPTGKQDYFPPMYGGICAIWFEIDGWRLESLAVQKALVEQLNERIIVSYTDIPHSSAVTNWAMLKGYIERQGEVVARMSDIKRIASAMRDALVDHDLDAFGRLLDAEWQLRRGLAEEVSTPSIDSMMAAARDAGALASKICGAGGGGCMITAAHPKDIPSVRAALTAAGAQILPAAITEEGIRVKKD